MIDRRFVATALALAATFLCGFILGEFIDERQREASQTTPTIALTSLDQECPQGKICEYIPASPRVVDCHLAKGGIICLVIPADAPASALRAWEDSSRVCHATPIETDKAQCVRSWK